jgi:hypothetical protein
MQFIDILKNSGGPKIDILEEFWKVKNKVNFSGP